MGQTDRVDMIVFLSVIYISIFVSPTIPGVRLNPPLPTATKRCRDLKILMDGVDGRRDFIF
jgi:hypothetical protein